MDYYSRYGLEYNPFIKNTKEVLVKTTEYNEITGRLNYLVENKGFGLLTGGPGKGKTTTIRNWSKTLNTSLYKVIYISLSTLTVLDFYRQLVDKLGGEVKFRKTDNFKAIQESITRYSLEKKMTPVIILDEANYMKNSILNDLKMVFNFEMDARDRAVVIFVGLPQMNNLLRLSIHEPLRQRITMSYHMDGMTKKEMKEYIEEKLSGANCHQRVFDDKALEAIANASNGVARVTNSLCNNSLMIANQLNQDMIDSEIVMKAVNEYEIG